MSVTASYLPNGDVEYIGDAPNGSTLWFHLNPETGASKFFDEQGKEIPRPDYSKGASLFKLVFGDERHSSRYATNYGE